MSRKQLDRPILNIAAGAPRSKTFYDRYHEDVLDLIERDWPLEGGYICLLRRAHSPEWLMLVQTPDPGLMESALRRWDPDHSFEILATRYFPDRLEHFDLIRSRLGQIASERKNHSKGTGEWFKVGADIAMAALKAPSSPPLPFPRHDDSSCAI